MNFLYKNRLLAWVLILLIVINISALVSFLLVNRIPDPVSRCSPEDQQCMAFRDELNLADAQTAEVNDINRRYNEIAGPLAGEIKEIRAAILTELERDEPDSLHIHSLAVQLAKLQLEIQKENIKQYLALKRVCTPEQAQRLSALYRDLYGCPMQDGLKKHRNRHGQH